MIVPDLEHIFQDELPYELVDEVLGLLGITIKGV